MQIVCLSTHIASFESSNTPLFPAAAHSQLLSSPLEAISKSKVASQQRSRAIKIYQSVETQAVLSKLRDEIQHSRLRIRSDRLLYADVGVRQNIVNMLLCYEARYLTLTMSVLFAPERIEASKLGKFIASSVLFDKTIAKKYESPTVKGNYRAGFKEELDKFTLEKILSIVWLLEQFKNANILESDCPRLFQLDSSFKSNKSVVIQFCKDYMAGEGDVLRHLALVGYKLMYEQSYIDEFDYSVTNIAVDLRDGVRLARVADLLRRSSGCSQSPSCVAQLRVPAVSRLQKIHNMDVALKALGEDLRVPVQEISSKDLVDGHRSKTLLLMWKIILMHQVPSLLPFEQLNAEIAAVQRSNYLKGLHSPSEQAVDLSDESIQYFQSPILTALLRWCQTVCVGYDLSVSNFTHAFSDGKVFCALINYYFSEALNWEEVRTTTRDLNKPREQIAVEQQDKPIDGNWVGAFSPPARVSHELRNALEGEKHNFELVESAIQTMGMVPHLIRAFDISNTTPDEKVIITAVAHLCWRLLGMQTERRAVMKIQKAWRQWYQIHVVAKKEAAASLIQKSWRKFVMRKRVSKLVARRNAELTIANAIYSYALRRRFLKLREAVQSIQSYWRGVLERRERCAKEIAAVCIQAAVRKMIAEKKKHREDAAVKIQAWWRMHEARFRFLQLKKAASTTARFYQAAQVRNSFLDMRDAAVKIQSFARMLINRRAYLEERSKIISIQAALRGQLQRARFVQQKSAATTLQRVARGMIDRKLATAKREAVSRIQFAARAHITQNKLRDFLAKTRAISCAARGYLARKELQNILRMQFIANVTKVQSLIRGCTFQGVPNRLHNHRSDFLFSRGCRLGEKGYIEANGGRSTFADLFAGPQSSQPIQRTSRCRAGNPDPIARCPCSQRV
jgi:abnormal spindle-like microcephaly-associated protein